MDFLHDHFAALPLGPGLTEIHTLTGENLFLVQGSRQAALIDTGPGLGDLPAFVRRLTGLPVTVLLTHGHVDHAPGCARFDRVYLHPADRAVYRRHCARRDDYVRSQVGAVDFPALAGLLCPVEPDRPFLELHGGMVFDLGGLHLRAVEFPGHTPGSLVFLLEEPRLLILGDACTPSTFLFLPESSSVAAYRPAVCRVRDALAGTYDHVYISHGHPETAPDILAQMVPVCDAVLAGQDDALPFTFGELSARIAKRCTGRFKRVDGGCANLVYDPLRVR